MPSIDAVDILIYDPADQRIGKEAVGLRPPPKMFAMPTITIDQKQHQFEITATYLAFLAYPVMPDDDEEREIFAAALCCDAIQVLAEVNPDWARTPQLISPMLVVIAPKTLDIGLRKGRKILTKRLEAARVARPFIEKASNSLVHVLPKEIERLSVNQVADFIVVNCLSSEYDAENIGKRIWRPALPVIHLASALEFGIYHFEKQHGRRPRDVEVLLTPGFIQSIIDHAQRIEAVLPEITAITLNADKFVRLRLA